jgi:hypothetical protein
MKKQLLLIVLVCTAPIILANAMFYFWESKGGYQHGELLTPVIPLENVSAQKIPNKELVDLKALQGKWRLIAIADMNSCNQACELELIEMRQIKLSMGEDLQRLKNTLLLIEPMTAENQQKYLKAFPLFDILENADEIISQVQAAFSLENARDGVFLIDPLGNIVMRYPLGSGPKGKSKDLHRLFKYNQLG